MSEIAEAFRTAGALLATAEPALVEIVALSLRVSLTALALAALVGLPLGAVLGVARFPGRRALVVLLNAGMGLPPVVVGLVTYLLLSRSGPIGALQASNRKQHEESAFDGLGRLREVRSFPDCAFRSTVNAWIGGS
jgi:ABC-type tungstate transport system substrate-binding protein